MFELLVSWHLNYLLHSTVLLLLAWAWDRSPRLRLGGASREALWRTALLGAMFSAALQILWTQGVERRLETPASAHGPAAPGHTETRNGAPFAGTPAVAESLESAPSVQQAPAAPGNGEAVTLATPRWRPVILPSSAALSGLSLLWLLVATGLLLRLLLRWWRLRRLVARLPDHPDARLQALLSRLTQASGQPRPRLLAGPWPSPLVAPGGAICLPAWMGDRLDEAQSEAVLGHELAHLSRRDPAWRLLTQCLLALGWLQVLNRLAARRLDELAELACDGWSARRQGQGRSLAESLLVCAERLREAGPLPVWVPAMAGHRSHLTRRIHHLLNRDPMQQPHHRPRWLIPAIVLTLGTAAIVSPMLVIGGPAPALTKVLSMGEKHTYTVITTDGKHGEGWNLQLRAEQIEFNAAEDQLTRLDGTLKVKQTQQGNARSLRVEGEPGSALKIRYAVNDQEQAPDAQGQAWIREALHRVADSVIGPEERAGRLLAQGGMPAALDWIEHRAGGDFQRRAVLLALFESPKVGRLDASEVGRVITLSQGIGSDFDRRETLNGLLAHQTLDPAQQGALLASVDGMHSDFDRRQVLETLNPKLADTPELLQAWTGTLARTHSDFDRRSVIENLVEREHLSTTQLDAALTASTSIGGDFDRRSALVALLPHLSSPAQVQTYARASASMGSDFDRRQVLVELIERDGALDKSTSLAVLSALQTMGSSFDLKEVLCTLASRMPRDAELLKALREQARRLPTFERGQVEQALDERA